MLLPLPPGKFCPSIEKICGRPCFYEHTHRQITILCLSGPILWLIFGPHGDQFLAYITTFDTFCRSKIKDLSCGCSLIKDSGSAKNNSLLLLLGYNFPTKHCQRIPNITNGLNHIKILGAYLAT